MEAVGHPTGRTENCSRHTGESAGHLHDRQATHDGKKEADKDNRVLGRQLLDNRENKDNRTPRGLRHHRNPNRALNWHSRVTTGKVEDGIA